VALPRRLLLAHRHRGCVIFRPAARTTHAPQHGHGYRRKRSGLREANATNGTATMAWPATFTPRAVQLGMSALGQKQTCAVHQRMSALCQKRTHGIGANSAKIAPIAGANKQRGNEVTTRRTLRATNVFETDTKAISVRTVYQLPVGISVGHNPSLAALCC